MEQTIKCPYCNYDESDLKIEIRLPSILHPIFHAPHIKLNWIKYARLFSFPSFPLCFLVKIPFLYSLYNTPF